MRWVKEKLLPTLKQHWVKIAVAFWVLWLSATLLGIQSDLNDIEAAVATLLQKVDDMDSSEQINEIQQTVGKIYRRMPY